MKKVDKKMKITVVGAGNLGLAITAYLARKKIGRITLYTKKKMPDYIRLTDVEEGYTGNTDNFMVTSSVKEAFSKESMVLCTYPAFLRKQFIKENEEYLSGVRAVVFIPGYGGIEYSCKTLIKAGVSIIGMQRVPYVARSRRMGDATAAQILSKKGQLFVAAIPAKKAEEAAKEIEELFDIETKALREYLAVTLAPSNPLLHLVGLYNIFHDYKEGMYYDSEFDFYDKWNDEASEMLLDYDEELQQVCRNMTAFDLNEVVPLRIYYEAETKEKMTEKLKSIEAFKCVKAPMKLCEKGYVPDFSSRMFVEDFGYGICILKAFALMNKVDTPVMDKLLDFYYDMTGIRYFDKEGNFTNEAENTGIPFVNGIKSMEDMIKLYK